MQLRVTDLLLCPICRSRQLAQLARLATASRIPAHLFACGAASDTPRIRELRQDAAENLHGRYHHQMRGREYNGSTLFFDSASPRALSFVHGEMPKLFRYSAAKRTVGTIGILPGVAGKYCFGNFLLVKIMYNSLLLNVEMCRSIEL